MTRLKVFVEANQKLLEDTFNAWIESSACDEVREHSIQYSPSLQKFVLSVIYVAKKN